VRLVRHGANEDFHLVLEFGADHMIVAFFDFKHGQTGVAPKAIELHPILDFACLSG
jgi:hypothetical protein